MQILVGWDTTHGRCSINVQTLSETELKQIKAQHDRAMKDIPTWSFFGGVVNLGHRHFQVVDGRKLINTKQVSDSNKGSLMFLLAEYAVLSLTELDKLFHDLLDDARCLIRANKDSAEARTLFKLAMKIKYQTSLKERAARTPTFIMNGRKLNLCDETSNVKEREHTMEKNQRLEAQLYTIQVVSLWLMKEDAENLSLHFQSVHRCFLRLLNIYRNTLEVVNGRKLISVLTQHSNKRIQNDNWLALQRHKESCETWR